MGDDDIICLSSDDDFPAEELPKKEPKLHGQVPLQARIEPEYEQKNATLSGKRKSHDGQNESDFPKKAKQMSTKIIEEIIIDSPQKGVREEPEQRIKIPTTLENRNPISISNVTSLKTSDNQPTPGSSSSAVLNPRNIANRSSASKHSNNNSITLKADDWRLTTEELSTESSQLNTDGSLPSVADVFHNFFYGANSKVKIMADSNAIPIHDSHCSEVTAESNVDEASIAKACHRIKTPITSRIESQSSTSATSNTPGKSNDAAFSGESSSRLAEKEMKCEKSPTKSATVDDSKPQSMPHCIKIAKSLNGARKSPVNSSTVQETKDCDTSNKETLRKTPSLSNGTVSKPKISLSKGASANKDSTSISSSNPQSHELASTPIISEVAVVVKRLASHKSESADVSKHSESHYPGPAAANSNNDKSSKSESGDSSSGRSKKSDAKIANGRTEKKSEARKIAKIQKGDSSKSSDTASAAGCSNSLDGTHKKSSKWEKESTRTFEPKPGCSKTPDNVDNSDKPQLVVKAKMPAYTCNQDTFPMFLSLCLQTDRDEAMKKIVAKLKRYYDEMDPAYAKSREFEELLNAKRDKIGEKGKKRVYLYTSHVMDEMRRRKKRKTKETEETDMTSSSGARTNAAVDLAANEPIEEEEEEEEGEEEEGEEEDDKEARRRKHNIKKIEHTMKICAKKIKKLEETEVGFDDDMNSSYMKLDRYQAKMIELWNKLCEYTNEHADAGRAYLRPKHVRVTKIPSVDQAINSFINSRLGVNKKKTKKLTSFVDGIVFPDYVDILECIAKVNDDQNLRLDKRTQEKIAQKAFTELGEHLQTTRRRDYWDTFSLHLENNEDPATKDAELAEKLAQNEEINRARTAEIFEEFVRKQEEARPGKRDDNSSDDEDEDEEEEEDDEEEADKKSNRDVLSDLELMEVEDEDEKNNKNKGDKVPSRQESIGEDKKEEDLDVEELAIPEEEERVNRENNDTDKIIASPAKSPKNSTLQEANENEVHTVEAENEDVDKPEGEKRSLLRIRSFAKPPESWQASQEESLNDRGSKPEVPKSNDIETIDVTDDDKIPSVSQSPEKNKQLKTLMIAGKTVVVKRFEKSPNGCVFNPENLPKLLMITSPVTSSKKSCSTAVVPSSNKLPTNPSSRHANLNNNSTNFGQSSKYVMIQPPSQSGQSNVSQRVRLNLKDGQQIQIRNPTITASGQVSHVQTRVSQQQGNVLMLQHLQVLRSQLTQLKNGKYKSTTDGARNPELSQQSRRGLAPGVGPVVRRSILSGFPTVQVGQTPIRETANMQVMRLANEQLIVRPVHPPYTVQIPQTGARDGKTTNSSDVSIVDLVTNSPAQSAPPVLRLRISDNISTASTTTSATVQQQRVGRPGDQNLTLHSREAPLKK